MSNETIIADYFHNNYPLEQLRGNMYHESNIYREIPYLLFRFSKELDESIYDELRSCIQSFKGQLKWTEFKSFGGRKIWNHLITPMEAYERQKYNFDNNVLMSEQEYHSEKRYKELCEKAIADIPQLFEHIKKNFNPDLEAYRKDTNQH